MAYTLLTQDEQDDIVAQFLLAQERDHFCHTINAERYSEMLKTLPDGEFKIRVDKLLSETMSRKAEVDAIIVETMKQVPDKTRLDAAIQRTKGL